MHWPGHISAGTRCSDLLSNVDLLPTILEICDMDVPDHIHGRSFATSLYDEVQDGTPEKGDEAIYAEMTWHCHYRPTRAIRTKEFKYIINFSSGIPLLLEDGAITRYGPAILEAHYAQPLAEDELYDLRNDQFELRNRTEDPEYKTVKMELRRRLLDQLLRTEDPILRGFIDNPEPEHTKQEYWYQQNGMFRLHEDGEWNQSAP